MTAGHAAGLVAHTAVHHLTATAIAVVLVVALVAWRRLFGGAPAGAGCPHSGGVLAAAAVVFAAIALLVGTRHPAAQPVAAHPAVTHRPASHPPPPRPVVIHETVTRVIPTTAGHPLLSGWQIVAIVVIVVGAGFAFAFRFRPRGE